jgi:PAS domain S-box-containing protein
MHSNGTDAGARLLARAAENLPEAMLAIDSSGRVVAANRTAHELLGRAPEELLGRRAHAVVHCEDGHDEVECTLGAGAHTADEPAEDVFVRGDGSSFYDS